MTTRRLGTFETAPIGFGCMGLSQGYGRPDRQSAIEAVHAALSHGVTLLDTAMSYGGGHNEQLVGQALRDAGESGDQAQVATKVGIVRDGDGVRLDAHPDRIKGYATESLRRLGRDVIDLYYLHRVDPSVPVEDQVGALYELQREGLVRHIGVSEVSADELRRAASVAPIDAVQLEWSLAWREPEATVIPLARELGIGIVAYSPLGRGLLSAHAPSQDPAASQFRGNDPRFAPESLQRNVAAAASLQRLARLLHLTPAQLALAWLIGQGEDVVAIPGSRDSQRVAANAAASAIELATSTLRDLDALSEEFVGDRHSFAVPTLRRTPA